MLLPLTQKDFCILSYSLIHSCHLLETASGSIPAPQLLVPIIRTRVVYLYIWLTSSKSGFQNDFLEFYKRVLENLEEKTWCFLLTYHRDTEGETHRGRHAGRETTCGVGDELKGWSSCFDSWAMRLHVCVIMPSFPDGFMGGPVMVYTWLSYLCLVMNLSSVLLLTLEVKGLLKAYP